MISKLAFRFLQMTVVAVPQAFSPALAQDAFTQPQASLSIVNALRADHNVYVSFDDSSIWPPGFAPGQSTAPVLFPAGAQRVKIECEGYAPAEAQLQLPAGANCALIIYPGEVVADGPDKGKRKISAYTPGPHAAGTKPTADKRWKIILVGATAQAELEVNGKKISLSPRKSADISGNSSDVRVSHNGKQIFSAAVEDAGEFWIVVFPAEDGLTAAMLNHSPFEIPKG